MRPPCGRKLRGGDYCRMDADHKGRCSSVTFYCDACGKVRRGRPHAHAPDEGGPDADPYGLGFCFMCCEVPPW